MQKEQLENSIKRGFNFGDLRFIRIYDLNLIPRYLMEQVRNRNLDVDLIYQAGDSITGNPFNIIYAIADKENMVIGIMWVLVNPLEKSVCGQILSVDKKHQNKGIAEAVRDYLVNLRDALKLETVACMTTRPRALEKLGFKRSKMVHMEVK